MFAVAKPRRSGLYRGLLHNIGRLGLFVVHPQEYADPLTGAAPNADLLALEREAFGVNHCEAGRWLAERWGLPEEVRVAAAEHHNPLSSGEFTLQDQVRVAVLLTNTLTDRCHGCAQGTQLAADPGAAAAGCAVPLRPRAGPYEAAHQRETGRVRLAIRPARRTEARLAIGTAMAALATAAAPAAARRWPASRNGARRAVRRHGRSAPGARGPR